jgi:hypothetical protein
VRQKSFECYGPHNWGQADAGVKECRDCGQIALESVALQRIIDEVKADRDSGVQPNAYNRVYHRHNR